MQLFFKRLLRIAKKILSDVHFSTQQEFEEYLRNHPGYRENTKFYVNGVQVKSPPKQKKPSTSQRSTKDLINTYGKLGETTLEYCFDSLFRTAISKKLDLNGFYKRNEKTVLNIINGFIKNSGYKRGLTSKEAESLFEHFLSKRNEEEKKKEEEHKKNGRKISDQELGEIVKEVVFNEEKLEEKINEYLNPEKYEEIFKELFDQQKKYIVQFGEERLMDMIKNYLTYEKIFKDKKDFIKYFFGNVDHNKINDALLNEIIPDFQKSFEETNEKLRKNGFAEISDEEFRKKFNEARFPLFDDDQIDKNKLKKFAEENVTNSYDINSYVPINEATILNTIQKLKREFPDLCKLKLGRMGLVENEDISACVSNGGNHLYFNSIGLSVINNKKGYNFYGGSTYLLGNNFAGIGFRTAQSIVKTVTTHEFAHIIKSIFYHKHGTYLYEGTGKKKPNGKEIVKIISNNTIIKKTEQAIEDLYNESMENGDIYKLTFYASTEPEEFWAEIFAIYYDDKSLLPPNILTKLEEIINDLKS